MGSATQKMHKASISEIQKFFVKVYELGNGVIDQPHFYACSVSFSQAPLLWKWEFKKLHKTHCHTFTDPTLITDQQF